MIAEPFPTPRTVFPVQHGLEGVHSLHGIVSEATSVQRSPVAYRNELHLQFVVVEREITEIHRIVDGTMEGDGPLQTTGLARQKRKRIINDLTLILCILQDDVRTPQVTRKVIGRNWQSTESGIIPLKDHHEFEDTRKINRRYAGELEAGTPKVNPQRLVFIGFQQQLAARRYLVNGRRRRWHPVGNGIIDIVGVHVIVRPVGTHGRFAISRAAKC